MNETQAFNDLELNISRLIDIPREKLYRCWTEPTLLEQWFTPEPWTTKVIKIDLRAGGASELLMRGPDGQEFPNRGVYLEVVPNERLVFTDAFHAGWQPSGQAFMVGMITFENEAGKTRYTGRAMHWNAADRDKHMQMGFYPGWNKATDQLIALAKTL